MRKIKPAGPRDSVAIVDAIQALRDARALFRQAGADRACKAVVLALKSAEGARRHVAHRIRRSA